MGKNLNDDELDDFIGNVDLKGDGQINFNEFL